MCCAVVCMFPNLCGAHVQYAVEGRNYVNFEFAANSGNFIRRAIAVVTVANGAPLCGRPSPASTACSGAHKVIPQR